MTGFMRMEPAGFSYRIGERAAHEQYQLYYGCDRGERRRRRCGSHGNNPYQFRGLPQKLEVRGKAKAVTRIASPAQPLEVLVNDGSVPELGLSEHRLKIAGDSKASDSAKP